MRVVRVTTEDGQRIVGIQTPRDRVGAVLRSLGDSRDLREPDEIFRAVLDKGEEVSLVSNLKLRRGLIHKEPAIELCGADPYRFAELRELGLINEQILCGALSNVELLLRTRSGKGIQMFQLHITKAVFTGLLANRGSSGCARQLGAVQVQH